MQDLVDRLTREHGDLVEVLFIEAYPSFDSRLVFSDGTELRARSLPDTDTGLLGGFTFGYFGTGSNAFSRFLALAGFTQTDVSDVRPPLKLRRDGTRVTGTERGGAIEGEEAGEEQ